MPTTIDKKVTRRCPDIKDDEGRQLEITLNDKNGGTVALRFVGLRSDPIEVPIKTLVKAALLTQEGEDLDVQPGWEDTMIDLFSKFCEDVTAIVDNVKDAARPARIQPSEDEENEDEDLDDL